MVEPAHEVEFRDVRNPAVWNASVPGVVITRVRWTIDAAGVHLLISGVARSTAAATVVATTNAGTVQADIIGAAAGMVPFELALLAPATATTCTVSVTNATGELDRVSFRLDCGLVCHVPDTTPANLEPWRIGFVAGVSDRIVQRYAFNLLATAKGAFDLPAWWADISEPAARFHDLAHATTALDISKLASELDTRVGDLYKTLRTTPISGDEDPVAHFVTQRSAAIRAAIQACSHPLTQSLRDELAKLPLHDKKPGTKPNKQPPRPASGIYGIVRRGKAVTIAIDDITLNIIGPSLDDMFNVTDFGNRVGVMFSDRLRFRPAGLVVGEQLYTLALSPGEEVQIRQSVETKRTAKLEDVTGREQEDQLVRSSSWSTDITQSVSDTETLQLGVTGNLGGTGGLPSFTAGPVSFNAPISATFGVSGSVNNAHTATRERANKVNQQLTEQATAKLRREHKTTIEITKEDTTSLSTTRTIRNANKVRAATFEFFKVYRREQVTLERHDARLALRLAIDDPGQIERERFLERISAIDPENPTNVGTSDSGSSNATPPIKIGDPIPYSIGDSGLWHPPDSPMPNRRDGELVFTRRDQIDVTIQADSGYTLANMPTLRIHSFRAVDTGGQRAAGGDETFSGADVEARYAERGGVLRWSTPPTVGSDNVTGRVEVDRSTHHYWRPRKNSFQVEYSTAEAWQILEITFEVVPTWSRQTPLTTDEEAAVDEQKAALAEQLTPARVLALRDIALANVRDGLLAQAISRGLLVGDAHSVDGLRQWLALDDLLVELIPYWATEAARLSYDEAVTQLCTLSIELPYADILPPLLTASQAIIYIPIRAGLERAALHLLPDLSDVDIDWLVREITNFRATHFPSTNTVPPTFEEIAGPVPPHATPMRASRWENDWERVPRKFEVLSAWRELVPTDGVHLEAIVADTAVADEYCGSSPQVPSSSTTPI